jgi:hypothetical protein
MRYQIHELIAPGVWETRSISNLRDATIVARVAAGFNHTVKLQVRDIYGGVVTSFTPDGLGWKVDSAVRERI